MLNAVEINSSFHRPHRRSTYARWAASVPDDFRFAVKLPKLISHQHRLVGCDDAIARFADEVAGLGEKRGPMLVQLPPSFAFPGALAGDFFAMLAQALPGAIACEPRHPSWFGDDADALLASHGVARVGADPARLPAAALPGAWTALAYLRLHGSPDIYRSAYDDGAIADHAAIARVASGSWTIYDNTTLGAATANALALAAALRDGAGA